jgi:hypothetical protein
MLSSCRDKALWAGFFQKSLKFIKIFADLFTELLDDHNFLRINKMFTFLNLERSIPGILLDSSASGIVEHCVKRLQFFQEESC